MEIKSNKKPLGSLMLLMATISIAFVSAPAHSQPSLTPILPLEFGSAKAVPLMNDSLSSNRAIGAQLTLARKQAGISTGGTKTAAPTSAYRRSLSAAINHSIKLEKIKFQQVLSFAIAIWRKVEGPKGTWMNPPFNLKLLGEYPESTAIVERQALYSWAKGDTQTAIKYYKSLSTAFSGEKQMGAIDRRILDFEEVVYQKTGTFKKYELAISSNYSKYSIEQAGYAGAKLMAANTKLRHEKLVHSALASATSPSDTKSRRLESIELAERYLVSTDVHSEKVIIKSAIARLWILNNQHKAAVKVYLDLANDVDPAKKPEYLALAAAAQRVIAKWPEVAPWKMLPRSSVNERMELLTIYKNLNDTRPRLDWPLLAHIGQLYIHLNNRQEAYTTWNAALKDSPYGPIAARASGTIIADYQAAKRWQELEDISRFCGTAKVVPIVNEKAINVNVTLALALLEGGKLALTNLNYRGAVKKLADFVLHFRAANRDQGMFLLATAYHGGAQYEQAIETTVIFSEEYASSKYYRQAMLNGGDWSVPMTLEDKTMYFYELFLKRFSSDPEGARVREELANLYLGRRLYAEAGGIISKQISVGEGSGTAELRLLRMEEKYGSTERAASVATGILKRTNVQAIQSEALAAKARQQAAKGEISALLKTESQLASMDDRSASQEFLGETRFLLASARMKPVLQPINSLALADPKAAIAERFKDFMNAKNSYHSVCDSGETSYCVPALHRIARIAERLITVIEDVTIPATFPEATVSAFDKEKSSIINSLSKESFDADEKSLKIAERGYTNPEWIQEVYWQNASDVNFERVSGESGRAYFQWPVSNED